MNPLGSRLIHIGTEKISPHQLFCLMFLFLLGSAIVVGIGIQANQDAWLAVLLGMVNGLPLYLIYIYLFTQYPKLPLTNYVQKILGKFLGVPLAIIYILYFFYIATRVLRDFGDLLLASTLDLTPLLVVNGLMMALIAYGVLRGIEVIGRTSEMIFFMLLILGFFGIFFIFISGLIKTENLAPFLEDGLKPILTTVYTQTYTFPFGEMIVFTMILPFLNKPHFGKKIGLYAILASGFILSITIALEITILGAQGVALAQFPLLETITKISIANFIQRLDVIVVATLILGVFTKIIVFFYAGMLGLADLLQIKKQKQWTLTVSLLSIAILISSMLIASNFSEHIKIGLKLVPIYLHLPLQTGIPILLFIITYIRRMFAKNEMKTEEM